VQLEKFHAAYGDMGCETSHLTFFRPPEARSISVIDLRTKLLEQDAIFVGGGNTKSALAVWREWGLDRVLKEAWENNVLLAGMSAGALCWFEAGLTDSFWGSTYRPIPCLGFLPGACAVHYSGDPQRRETLHAAHLTGSIPPSIAIDDYAAVLYTDHSLARVLSWQAGATAYQVHCEDGAVIETALPAESIC
jgi:peptidase E